MPRKNTTTASKTNAEPKALAKARAQAPKVDTSVIVPIRHSAANPLNDPEATPTKVSSVASFVRTYFKGLQILKAYTGRTLKYFVKMGDGITCFMFPPGGDEERMFVHLMDQPKVAQMVPLDPGEKPGQAIAHIQLNGLRMNVLKGRIVYLPQQVSEELSVSQNLLAEATSVLATNPFTGEQVNANLAYRDETELRALTR